jgi:cobalt-zinc-cadmium efflux system outer membrane protein
MKPKSLIRLLLHFTCIIVGFYGLAIADQSRITTQPNMVASSDRDSNTQDHLNITELTLEQAQSQTLKHNPVLVAFASDIRARDAAVLQSNLFPNPELDVEIENFGGEDELKSFDGAETTISLSQLIELGGKRNKRNQIAVLEKDLADWNYQSQKLDILTSVSKAFIETMVAQEQVALNNDLVNLAGQTAIAVAVKADAGKVSPIEKTKAMVELASAESEASKAARELKAAKSRLAGFWGSASVEFKRVTGDLTNLTDLPSEDLLKTYLRGNPDLARWKSETDRSQSALALAHSEAFPDLTLSAGVRNFQETDDNAFVAGISIPIPLFNRNQGGIAEARELIGKVNAEQRAVEATILSRFSDTWQTLSGAYEESMTLQNDILPGAREAYESTEAGYREGKLDYLQMLDAQRTYFTVIRQYLMALGTYHMARTDMERLINVSLNDVVTKTKN